MKTLRRWIAAKVAPKPTFLVKGQRYAGIRFTLPAGTKGAVIRDNTFTPE